ncbi:hypothetical protein ACWCQR_38155, partial [Streptomyces sp. NPDC002172]
MVTQDDEYRTFTADVQYHIKVSVGGDNSLVNTITGGTGRHLEAQVLVFDAAEMTLADDDLHDHPEWAALVAADSLAKPGAEDQRLPSWFVEGKGNVGFGTVLGIDFEPEKRRNALQDPVRGVVEQEQEQEQEPEEGKRRNALQDLVRGVVEQVTPGVTKIGSSNYTPGVRTLINDVTTSSGPSSLAGDGPGSRAAFHYIDRTFLGFQILEVTVFARPDADYDLGSARGRRAMARKSGLEKMSGRSNGAGGALPVPGTTYTGRTKLHNQGLGMGFGGRAGNHMPTGTVGVDRTRQAVHGQTSAREERTYQRSSGGTTKFRVPYVFTVEVRARPLDQALLARLVHSVQSGLLSTWEALGQLYDWMTGPADTPRTVARPSWSSLTSRTVKAWANLRFSSSNDARHGTSGESRTAVTLPAVFDTDPLSRPQPPEGGTAVEMQVALEVRDALNGPLWVPSQPVQFRGFAGTGQLGEALIAVGAASETDTEPLTNWSADDVVVRLNSLVDSRKAELSTAAVAPLMGRNAVSGVEMTLTLHSPHIVVSSGDAAVDGMHIATDGFKHQGGSTTTAAASFSLASAYGRADNGAIGIPLGGAGITDGQSFTGTSMRREVLRFGTEEESATGDGHLGHLVRVLGLLEIKGPAGTRWVTGDILLRTTETPPTSSEPPGSVTAEPARRDTDVSAGAESRDDGSATGAPHTDREDFDERLERWLGPNAKHLLDSEDFLNLPVSLRHIDGLTDVSRVRPLLAKSRTPLRVTDLKLGYPDRARLAWRFYESESEDRTPDADSEYRRLRKRLGKFPEKSDALAGIPASVKAEGVAIYSSRFVVPTVIEPDAADEAVLAGRRADIEAVVMAYYNGGGDPAPEAAKEVADAIAARRGSQGGGLAGLPGGTRKKKSAVANAAPPPAAGELPAGSGSGAGGRHADEYDTVLVSAQTRRDLVTEVNRHRNVAAAADRQAVVDAAVRVLERMPQPTDITLRALVDQLLRARQTDPDLTTRLSHAPDVAYAVVRQPELFRRIAEHPSLLGALAGHPAVLESLSKPQSTEWLTEQPGRTFEILAREQVISGLESDDELRRFLLRNAGYGSILRHLDGQIGIVKELFALADPMLTMAERSETFAAAILELPAEDRTDTLYRYKTDLGLAVQVLGTYLLDPEPRPVSFYRTLLTDTKVHSTLRRHPQLRYLALSSPDVLAAVVKDPGLLDVLAHAEKLSWVLRDLPDVTLALLENPELLEAAIGNGNFAAALSHDPGMLDSPEGKGLLDRIREASAPQPELAQPKSGRSERLEVTSTTGVASMLAYLPTVNSGMHWLLNKAPDRLAMTRKLLTEENLKPILRVLTAKPEVIIEPYELRRLFSLPPLKALPLDDNELSMGVLWLVLMHPALAIAYEDAETLLGERKNFENLFKHWLLYDEMWDRAEFAWAVSRDRRIVDLNVDLERILERMQGPWTPGALYYLPHVRNLIEAGKFKDLVPALYAGDGALLRLLIRQNHMQIFLEGDFARWAGSILKAPTLLDGLTDSFGKLSATHWQRLLGNESLYVRLDKARESPAGKALFQYPEALREAVSRSGFADEWEDKKELFDKLATPLLVQRLPAGSKELASFLAAIQGTGPSEITPEGHEIDVDRLAGVLHLTRALKGEWDVNSFRDQIPDDVRLTDEETERYGILLDDERLRGAVIESHSLAEAALFVPYMIDLLRTRPGMLGIIKSDPSVLRQLMKVDRLPELLAHNDDAYAYYRDVPGSRPALLGRYVKDVLHGVRYYLSFTRKYLSWLYHPEYRALWDLAESPSVSSAMMERPSADRLIMANAELRNLLGEVDEVVRRAVTGTDGRLAAAEAHPATVTRLALSPRLADFLAADFDVVATEAQWRLLFAKPELVTLLHENPETIGSVLDPEVLPVAVEVPRFVEVLATADSEMQRAQFTGRLVLSLVRNNPDIVSELGPESAMRSALTEIPELAELLMKRDVLGQFMEKEGLLDAVRGNRALLREAAAQSDVWKLWLAHPELRVSARTLKSLSGRPKAVEYLTRHARFQDADLLGRALSRPGVVALLASDEGFAGVFLSTPGWQRMAVDMREFAEEVRMLRERTPRLAAGVVRAPDTLADVLRERAAARRAVVAPGGGSARGEGGTRSGAGSVSRSGDVAGPPGSARSVGEVVGDLVGDAPVVGEVVPDEAVALLTGSRGEEVGSALAEHPELLPVLLASPRVPLEIASSRERLDQYYVRPLFERVLPAVAGDLLGVGAKEFGVDAFERRFGVFYAKTGVGSGSYGALRAAALRTWRKLAEERWAARQEQVRRRAERFADFDVVRSRGEWEFSNRIHYAGGLGEKDFEDAQHKVLLSVAQGQAVREDGLRVHVGLHAHLDGGRGGVAFVYVLAPDGRVDLLVYAKSESRTDKNLYKWTGPEGKFVKGPPTLESVANNEVLLESRRLLASLKPVANKEVLPASGAPVETRAEQMPAGDAREVLSLPEVSELERDTVAGAVRLSEAASAYRSAVAELVAPTSDKKKVAEERRARALLDAGERMRGAGADVFGLAWEDAESKPELRDAVAGLHEGSRGTVASSGRRRWPFEADQERGAVAVALGQDGRSATQAVRRSAAQAVVRLLRADRSGAGVSPSGPVRAGLPGGHRPGAPDGPVSGGEGSHGRSAGGVPADPAIKAPGAAKGVEGAEGVEGAGAVLAGGAVAGVRADRAALDERIKGRLGKELRDLIGSEDFLGWTVSPGDIEGLTDVSRVRGFLDERSAPVSVQDLVKGLELGYADRARLAWRFYGSQSEDRTPESEDKLFGKLPEHFLQEALQGAGEGTVDAGAEGIGSDGDRVRVLRDPAAAARTAAEQPWSAYVHPDWVDPAIQVYDSIALPEVRLERPDEGYWRDVREVAQAGMDAETKVPLQDRGQPGSHPDVRGAMELRAQGLFEARWRKVGSVDGDPADIPLYLRLTEPGFGADLKARVDGILSKAAGEHRGVSPEQIRSAWQRLPRSSRRGVPMPQLAMNLADLLAATPGEHLGTHAAPPDDGGAFEADPTETVRLEGVDAEDTEKLGAFAERVVARAEREWRQGALARVEVRVTGHADGSGSRSGGDGDGDGNEAAAQTAARRADAVLAVWKDVLADRLPRVPVDYEAHPPLRDTSAVLPAPADGRGAVIEVTFVRRRPGGPGPGTSPADPGPAGEPAGPDRPSAPGDRTGDTSPSAPQTPASGETDGTPPAASGPDAPADPEFRAPWYTEHGMLGEATVRDVRKWERPEAEQAARQITERLADKDLARQLLTPLTELFAENTPATWQKLLRQGRVVALKDRLVWLRPVADAMVPVQPARDGEAERSDPVRRYQVRFNATSATQSRSKKHAHGVDAMLFTAVSLASEAASTLVLGVPYVSVETSSGTADERKRTVITGHKTVVEASVPFEAAVRMRVFADGVEVSAEGAPAEGAPAEGAVAEGAPAEGAVAEGAVAEGAVVPRGLVIELPTAFVQTDNLHSVDDSGPLGSASSVTVGGDTTGGSFQQGREVVNAVDLTPTVAALQAELRRRGLAPKAAKDVVEQLLPLLNESVFRNFSQWWLTSGVVSPAITQGVHGPRRYFRARATQRPGTEEDARPVGVSTLRTRLDLGGGMGRGRTQMKKSAVVYQVLANVAGWVHPAAQQSPPVKGYAPMAAFGFSFSRQVSQTLQSQSQTHAIFTVKEPYVRYRHTYDTELDWLGSNGEVIFTIKSEAPAETGVPQRAEAGGQPGPVAALPYVRQVLRESGLALQRTMIRPRRLDDPVGGPVLKDGQARPPRALALGMGLGFAVGSGLPGGELVEDHLRHVLKDLPHGGTSVRWEDVDRLLSTHFGQPALEGVLGDLMAGIQHTIELGGKPVRIRVRARLLNHLGSPPRYPMTVNNRAAVGETATPRSVFSVSGRGSFGGAPRFGLGRAARLQVTALAHVSRTREFGQAVGDESKTYRRMENEGLVDDHRYEVVYELAVAYGPGFHRVEKWWIDRRGELSANVTVPRRFAPVTEEKHDGAGQVTYLRAWPDDGRRSLSFTGGASGVYPAFLHTTALPALAVSLMYALNGRPAPRATEWTQWPDEVVAATGPGELASYFGQLVGVSGREIPLPDMDGWHQALTLRLRVDRPRVLPHPEGTGPTEIEQYLRSSFRSISMDGTLTAAGFRGGLGTQERFGSDSGNDIELADPHDITDPHDIVGPHDGADSGPLPGGRLMQQVYGEADVHIGNAKDTGLGSIEVTRVTYNDAGLLRADAAFEVTLTRWRDKEHQKVSRVLLVRDGLDLLIPLRRQEDVLPAALPAPDSPRQAAGSASVNPEASLQRVPRDYLGGRPLHTSVYPETLEADEV